MLLEDQVYYVGMSNILVLVQHINIHVCTYEVTGISTIFQILIEMLCA